MFNKRLQALQTDFQNSWQKLNLDAQLAELHSLEQAAAEPELWLNPERAKSIHTALARQTAETEPWILLKTQLDDLGELLALDQGDLTTELDTQLTTLEQTYQDLKKSLRFTGLLAHRFENVIPGSILFDLEELDLDGFFGRYRGYLEKAIRYGFPHPGCRTAGEVREMMEREGIRAFDIGSSLGLWGFVLAREAEICRAAGPGLKAETSGEEKE